MNVFSGLIGLITIIIGAFTIAAPFLPPENICDFLHQQDAGLGIVIGIFLILSGLLNIFRSLYHD